MASRQQRPGLEFGSDSFLDVVCNIVGILIILIVVVSMKVQRQPEHDAAVAEAQAAREATAEQQEADLRAIKQAKLLAEESESEILARVEELQAKRDLTVAQIQQLNASLAELQQRLERTHAEAEKSHQKAASVESSKAVLMARVASLQKTLETRALEAQQLGASLSRAISEEKTAEEQLQNSVVETVKLTEVLKKTEAVAEPSDRLKHRLMPVSRVAEKGEIHFRISNGRISEIPIEGLLKRLERHVRTAGFREMSGIVGPVAGYHLSYNLERTGSSGLEALQNGTFSSSLQLSRWEIVPDNLLNEETLEEAVRPGSHYRNVIETADPDVMVTMWIYPDSFGGFHPVREIAHSLQLRVAARPLPFGQAIVGSQSGSKSSGQ